MGKVRIKQRMLVHWKVLRHPVTDRVFQMTDPEIIIAGPSSPGEQRMHDTCACARSLGDARVDKSAVDIA